tara:strand:+ start:2000 stop:3118 length:1119 start_codon:yes stop_codon:yes gene_type:complete
MQKHYRNIGLQNILLITKEFPEEAPGGRELLNKLNLKVLENIFGPNLKTFFLPITNVRTYLGMINAFRGHIDGININSIQSCMTIIKEKKIDLVFVDGSNLGTIVKVGKNLYPNVKFITFFHNAEYYFFKGLWKKNLSLKAFFLMGISYLVEKNAVSWSDRIIALNQRDALDIQILYGCKNVAIYPMSLEDKLGTLQPLLSPKQHDEYALFVGGFFYANYHGIRWFVKEVVPLINIKIIIVGRGFESVRSELEIQDQVTVVGSVDDLSQYYLNAKFVVAPIFDGSGMKTKTAEALMYGKKIIGTDEAFTGYEKHIAEVGWLCNSPKEFAIAIEEATKSIESYFDPLLREIYCANYSIEAAEKKMLKILSQDT